MDEMKIKKRLVFNKNTVELTGFVDLGSVNSNLERVFAEEEANSEGGDLADQVFVFTCMTRTIFKPSLSMPVAHYFSSKLKG